VLGQGLSEGGSDDGAGDLWVCADVQGVAGAVVEPADDLHVGAGLAVGFGQAVVGEVGLPALIRQVGLEADVGRLRSFLRLGGDPAGAGEVAGDGGPGHLSLVVVFQVPGDGLGAGV
jgi:hypothetical protein